MTERWDGRPENSERDGWHWLHHRIESKPQPVEWVAEIDAWASGAAYSPEGVVELGWRYRGPCLTPAEVAAREAAARREGIEAAAREMECGCPDETKAAVLEALRDGHNSKKRWQACGHSQCSTIDAFDIRALLEDGR